MPFFLLFSDFASMLFNTVSQTVMHSGIVWKQIEEGQLLLTPVTKSHMRLKKRQRSEESGKRMKLDIPICAPERLGITSGP